MARPAIAGGVLLAVMETIADFGTVAYFGVQTFATGIYTSWFSLADRAGAAQLALCLLSFALLLAMLERAQRGRAKYHDPSRRQQTMEPAALNRPQAALAMVLCGVPVLLGAVLPIIILLNMGLGSEQNLLSPRYLGFIRNSLTLASVAAVVTVLSAIGVGFYQRLRPSRWSNGAAYVARLGYAVPGGVIAVGLLVPFAMFDNALDAWMRATFDVSTGLLVTGSIWLLVAAYLVRFLAAALGAYEGGQAMVPANMDAAARSLGQTPTGTLRRVHLPILAPSLLTALLIVFVDVMKELPATLLLRPNGFETLLGRMFEETVGRDTVSDGHIAQAAEHGQLLQVVAVADLDAAVLGQKHGQHLGIMLIELGVGITVASVMILIFFSFAGRGRTP